MIRSATAADAAAIAAIYNPFIVDTVVTFEEEPLTATDLAARIAEVRALPLPWLVVEQDGVVRGYACATRWKTRASFRHTVETAIYLGPEAIGRGTGRLLYAELMRQLQAGGIHVAIAGIALPNAASVALHERLGFRRIGQFGEVGRKFGRWIDVGYWQLTL
jgi:L-amino acid N-acyltransferase YncA